MPKAFQVDGQQFDKRFLFVGPSFAEPSPAPWPFAGAAMPGTIKVYISLGTLRNNEPGFYQKCFSAFHEPHWQVLMAVGDKIDPQTLHPVPENFLIRKTVPQIALLPQVDVFVSHGGLNSTMESLYYGVPLVVLPSIREQVITAQRLQTLHLGVVLDRTLFTAEDLRTAAITAMQTDTTRSALRDMKAQVRDAGGYMRATDAILEFSA